MHDWCVITYNCYNFKLHTNVKSEFVLLVIIKLQVLQCFSATKSENILLEAHYLGLY